MSIMDIRNQLLSYWSSNYKTTPTLYQNAKLPDNLKKSPFVSFEIEFSESLTVGSGGVSGTQIRHKGFIAIAINTPIGSGNKTAYTLADEVVSLLSHKRIGSLSTRAGYVDNEFYREEHYCLVVIVPFFSNIG